MHHHLAECFVPKTFYLLTDCRLVLFLILLAVADHLLSRSLVGKVSAVGLLRVRV